MRNTILLMLAIGQLFVGTVSAFAQQAQLISVSPLNIQVGDYSGITRIGDTDGYGIVSDKADGLFLLQIPISAKGKVGMITRGRLLNGSLFEDEVTPRASEWFVRSKGAPKENVVSDSLKVIFHDGIPNKHIFNQWTSIRDCEGIAFLPSRKTFFISGEADQLILEYDSIGTLTGRSLEVPKIFSRPKTGSNYGFEALCYNKKTDRFYVTTENTLPFDGSISGPGSKQEALLRVQSFSATDLSAKDCYAYLTDKPQADSSARNYAFGVPELCALPSGDLLVLEREFWVGNGLSVMNSYVVNKLYRVSFYVAQSVTEDTPLKNLDKSNFLPKTLVYSWRTSLSNGDIANYEGMCLGPQLADGRQTLLLINDSQHGYKGILGEYLMILALPE